MRKRRLWIGCGIVLIVIALVCAGIVFRSKSFREMLSVSDVSAFTAVSVLDPAANSFSIEDSQTLNEVYAAVNTVRVRFCGWASSISPTDGLYTLHISADGPQPIPSFSIRDDGYLFLNGKKYQILNRSGDELLGIVDDVLNSNESPQ